MTVSARARDEISMLDTAQALGSVQVSLRAALERAPWPAALTAVAHDVLTDPRHVLGGRLTPWALMPLCCCAAVSGDWHSAVPAAAAAELYSTALDLFDDIEDGDTSGPVERHGAPVVLNLATALLALAHLTLRADGIGSSSDQRRPAQQRAQDALWQGLAVATGGQHLYLTAAGVAPLSLEQCLDIARRKGGALAEACCRAGAACGTDDDELIALCGALGCALGLGAQLDNDMHDAGGDTGKSDLARRTQTVPVALARAWYGADALDDAVWQGGVQMAYALLHAELARADELIAAIAARCPESPAARTVLQLLQATRGPQQTS